MNGSIASPYAVHGFPEAPKRLAHMPPTPVSSSMVCDHISGGVCDGGVQRPRGLAGINLLEGGFFTLTIVTLTMTRVLAVTLRGYGSLLMVLCLAFCARPVSDISAVTPSGSVRNYETTDPTPPWPPLGAGSVSVHPPLPSAWSNTDFYPLASSTSGFVLHARAALREHVYELASKASTASKAFIGAYRYKTDRFSQFSRLAVLYHEPFVTRTSPRSAFIPPTRTTSVDNPAPPAAGHVWRKSPIPVDVDAPIRRRSSLWLHDGMLGNSEPWGRRLNSIDWSSIALGVLASLVCLSVVSKVLISSSTPAGIIDIDDELEIHYMLQDATLPIKIRGALGPSLSASLTCSVESREMVGMEIKLQVEFLFPGLPGEPIVYLSTGFVEQESSSPLSMSSILDNIIALERSTLEAVYPHLHGATVKVRLEVAVGAYTVFYDRSGAKYITGADPERRGVRFSASFLPCARQPTAPIDALICGGDCSDSEVPDVYFPITIQYFKFPLMRVVADHPRVYYGPVILVPDEMFAGLLFGTQQPTPSGRPPLLIEWVSEKSSPQNEVQEPPAAPVPQPSPTRVRPQRAARPGHSVYRPPRLQQAHLTEERRLERARQQQQLLEQAERELEAAEAATEEPDKRKRGRRGGRQARERAERRDFHALAAMEYVRGE